MYICILACLLYVIGCVEDVDQDWGILWPATDTDKTATQKCPGGVESLGI